MPHFNLFASAVGLVFAAVGVTMPALADHHMTGWTVDLKQITDTGVGDTMATVTIAAAEGRGVSFRVSGEGFSPGEHGFHVHQNASCQPAESGGEVVPGGAAGGHWDPENTGTHQGPEGDGHLGDLPRLTANAEGKIDQTVIAPRITDMGRLAGHALMVHQGGDTYSDEPRLGGGGARVACGVIARRDQ